LHLVWHHKGDYLSTLTPNAGAQAVAIHQLSKGIYITIIIIVMIISIIFIIVTISIIIIIITITIIIVTIIIITIINCLKVFIFFLIYLVLIILWMVCMEYRFLTPFVCNLLSVHHHYRCYDHHHHHHHYYYHHYYHHQKVKLSALSPNPRVQCNPYHSTLPDPSCSWPCKQLLKSTI
jgi:energy-coupling factor transporter transmembrane protein EcfT